jgi:hypothetical protein
VAARLEDEVDGPAGAGSQLAVLAGRVCWSWTVSVPFGPYCTPVARSVVLPQCGDPSEMTTTLSRLDMTITSKIDVGTRLSIRQPG